MEDTKPVIKVDHVSKEFALPHEKADTLKSVFTGVLRGKRGRTVERQSALKDVSFEIKEGEFFGIVGRNGSGKSTLLKILAGIYTPTSGGVNVSGRLVPFIELGVGFNHELTGRENVYLSAALLGFSKKQVDAMYQEIVDFAELEKFMDQKLKNYSSGMQVRLAFSIATRAHGDILLIDEVLAVGDADFQRKCFDYFRELKKNKKTVVFVTHDMAAVREYCDRVILIEKSEVVLEGKAAEVAPEYTKMFEKEQGIGTGSKDQQRWGDGAGQISKVSVTPKKVTDNDSTLALEIELAAKRGIPGNSVVGFQIRSADGTIIQGVNTKMLGKVLKPLKKGQKLKLKWTIPNIFEDGQHFVGVTFMSSDFAHTYDWWEDALVFRSYREQRTPYAVAPANVELTLDKREEALWEQR